MFDETHRLYAIQYQLKLRINKGQHHHHQPIQQPNPKQTVPHIQAYKPYHCLSEESRHSSILSSIHISLNQVQ